MKILNIKFRKAFLTLTLTLATSLSAMAADVLWNSNQIIASNATFYVHFFLLKWRHKSMKV
ncbi:MAG: hypothetical protein LBR36_08430 [Bacteroidales bacterium]|jgi:hypothetical protein|nr:hypothetical protein [Bacteroidales bacterium]